MHSTGVLHKSVCIIVRFDMRPDQKNMFEYVKRKHTFSIFTFL